MEIITVSGSSSKTSTNTQFLQAISREISTASFRHCDYLSSLPLFQFDKDHMPYPREVIRWRQDIDKADAVIISTPAYLNNIPAILKNALEWLTSSGELQGKQVIAMTVTPHPPRGATAMKSLLWCLEALEARIVVQSAFYQTEYQIDQNGLFQGNEIKMLIGEMMQLLFEQ